MMNLEPNLTTRYQKHDVNNMEYKHFLDIFMKILNMHAAMKKIVETKAEL